MNRSKLVTRITICCAVCFGIIFLLGSIIPLISKDNTDKFLIVFGISGTLVIISFIIFVLVHIKELNKEEQKNAQRTLNNLSSDFQDVHLESINLISKDEFKCKARLDENGEVVCNIKADIEMRLPVERFLDYFTTD